MWCLTAQKERDEIMIQKITDKLKQGENKSAYQALRIYDILKSYARNRQTILYGELAEQLGYNGAKPIVRMLAMVHYWCEAHDLPEITSIVVKRSTGKPGWRYLTPAHQQRAYEFDWSDIIPPTVDDFLAVWNEE